MSEIQLTIEKSKELAEIIEMIKIYIRAIDLEYLKTIYKEMLAQVNRQESMIILNPSHPMSKNDLLLKQAIALGYLSKYIEILKEIDLLKRIIIKEEKAMQDIKNLFL